MTPEHETAGGSWGEIFRDGRGLYSALVIGGIAMQATQMLVIAIIMPPTSVSALSPTVTILTFGFFAVGLLSTRLETVKTSSRRRVATR